MQISPNSRFVTGLAVVFLMFAADCLPVNASEGSNGIPKAASVPLMEPKAVLAQSERQTRLHSITWNEALFKGVLRLIRQNYVDEVSDAAVFAVPVRKLMMMLPPLCGEEIPDVAECGDAAEDCLLGTIRTIAHRCDMDEGKLCLLALGTILRDLDPNTCLLDEAMLKELAITTSGKFGGVGVMVAPRNGDYVVISPFEGSPAYRAGIRAGDTMMEIDGRAIHDLPLLEVLRKVRGPVGSLTTFTVKSAKTGDIRHVRLRRKTIVIPPVRHGMVSDGIGYLRIVNFQSSTRAEIEKALHGVTRRGPLKGLILDLRDNPGGLLDQAVQVANLFVHSGTITSLIGRNKQLGREFKADGRAVVDGTPLVVLINRGSASASEVLAGALQGRPNVIVMGERSFGKASVQAVYPLGSGTALRLTTAHYFTAQGRNIEGKGLEPDVPVEEPTDNHATETIDSPDPGRLLTDPWIRKAFEALLQETSSESGLQPPLY